jgi:serine/threonine protein phosphatase PrpC
MQNAEAMLYCPNFNCQTPNPETHKFCQKCRAPLPRHYLWAIGEGIASLRPGDVLADRYLCKAPRIFLDTKPGLLPNIATGIPEPFAIYLRLSPYQIHLPQVYDLLQDGNTAGSGVLLLDQAAIYLPGELASHGIDLTQFDSAANSGDVQLLPHLSAAWQNATALRQLSWMWQMAQLWQPLSSEHVVTTLLDPELLRVEGPLLRLLELRSDRPGKPSPTLVQLGQLWSEWIQTTRPEIAPFVQQICQQLLQGQIKNAELLVHQLDEALAAVGRSQPRQFQWATRTDRGPSRQRNEDACYPPDGTLQTKTVLANQPPDGSSTLVIVCDGIGGHQGGDVASNLAIEAVGQRVQPLQPERLDPITLTVELENAVCIANDRISQRNDNEQRFDRQRMGTTLVMGLVRAHELYITHVGDSRAYWITRWGCRQVTQDDDVASREVRLGYSSYRQALQQPSAGSLVQALGMGTSKALHPSVQRFILDEDGVFLLCSDGLSDNDRVEECWETEILPLLDGKTDLAKVSQRLVEIANTRNGYDNVTIGLIYYQVEAAQSSPTPIDLSSTAAKTRLDSNVPTTIQTERTEGNTAPAAALSSPSQSTLKTQLVAPRERKPNPLSLVLGILLLLGLGSGLVYFFVPAFSDRVDGILGLNPASTPTADADPEVASSAESSPDRSIPFLRAGSYIQLSRATSPDGSAAGSTLVLLSQPNEAVPNTAPSSPAPSPEPTGATTVEGSLPLGSVLQIVRRQTTQQERWVLVRVCSVPSSEAISEQAPGGTNAAGNAARSSPTASIAPAAPPNTGSGAPGSPSFSKLLKAGQTGWIREAEILPLVLPSASPSPIQQGTCTPTAAVPAPTPSPVSAGSPVP